MVLQQVRNKQHFSPVLALKYLEHGLSLSVLKDVIKVSLLGAEAMEKS
jgi:hypothetical protein